MRAVRCGSVRDYMDCERIESSIVLHKDAKDWRSSLLFLRGFVPSYENHPSVVGQRPCRVRRIVIIPGAQDVCRES